MYLKDIAKIRPFLFLPKIQRSLFIPFLQGGLTTATYCFQSLNKLHSILKVTARVSKKKKKTTSDYCSFKIGALASY